MKVKFADLTTITNQVSEEFLSAAKQILERGNFILTQEVEDFEKAWAKEVGVKYALGVSNGADALYLCLMSLGIKSGDEVIVQGNAYNASVTAILRVGAIPKFVDINPKTLCLNTDLLEKAITKNTKAILPVHLYGLANNMEKIMEIAKAHNLVVVEDCAQAHLAGLNNTEVSAGGFGQVGAFSFYPTKNLGAFGDAGAITTNDENIYKKISVLRNLGQAKKNDHQMLGFNMRLDSLQAAALSIKLKYLKDWTKTRQIAGEYYKNKILQVCPGVKFQHVPSGYNHVYHLFVVILPNGVVREKVKSVMYNFGVETAVHYPLVVYKQPFYNLPFEPCPVAEDISERILSLPFFVGITNREQDYVVDSLKKAIYG